MCLLFILEGLQSAWCRITILNKFCRDTNFWPGRKIGALVEVLARCIVILNLWPSDGGGGRFACEGAIPLTAPERLFASDAEEFSTGRHENEAIYSRDYHFIHKRSQCSVLFVAVAAEKVPTKSPGIRLQIQLRIARQNKKRLL
jgi:hypothetical protein